MKPATSRLGAAAASDLVLDRVEPVLPGPHFGSGAAPCSMKWKRPPARSTRRASRTAAALSGMVHKLQVHSTASTLIVDRQALPVQTDDVDADRRHPRPPLRRVARPSGIPLPHRRASDSCVRQCGVGRGPCRRRARGGCVPRGRSDEMLGTRDSPLHPGGAGRSVRGRVRGGRVRLPDRHPRDPVTEIIPETG
jgi:hypothetical protein